MNKYTVVMRRVYETVFDIEATSIDEAEQKFIDLGEQRYIKELEQCSIVEENISIDALTDYPNGLTARIKIL